MAILALAAADEIDDLSLGKRVQPAATLRLAQGLRGSFVQSQNPVVLKHFIDSGSVAILCRALGDCGSGSGFANLGALALRANEMCDALVAAVSIQNTAELGRVRDFCLALASASNSFRHSVYDLRPPHPFRS
jgi:hypothetical protein